jgi:hypothetical protein
VKGKINWSLLLEVIGTVIMLYVLFFRGDVITIEPRLWRALMIWCHKAAYTIGKGGIYAEKAYYNAIEKVR